MLLPRIEGRAWRLRWGVAALVITAPLAMAGTANAGTGALCDVPGAACAESIQWVNVGVAPVPGSTATFTNLATESDTTSRHAYQLSVNYQNPSASEITATNTANAAADCQGCDAIAVALQVVIGSRSTVSAIDATDTATATTNCSCQALSEAFQLVTSFNLFGNAPFMRFQFQQLSDALQRLVSNPNLSNSTLQSRSTQDVEAFAALVQRWAIEGPTVAILGRFMLPPVSFTSQPTVYLLSEFHH